MTLGFYYHVPVNSKNESIFVPGYLGIFLDDLASNVNELYLFMHCVNPQQIAACDYELVNKNIKFINLGISTPAWHRHIFHKKLLGKISVYADACDAIIIRAPSPLAPFFKKYFIKPLLVFMVVGDYLEGANTYKIKNLRDWIMIQYLKRNDAVFRKAMRHIPVLVNAPALYKKYQSTSISIHLIKTSTLTENDFFERNDTCQNETIVLLYTGRIEAAKGLFELVEAVADIRNYDINVELTIVGWEADPKKTVEQALIKKGKELKIENYIKFEGRKKIGPELNEMYRQADIYVIPSYHEGFPRTIWEAMANSLPVIATSVGGIPDYLTDHENAIFVEPKKITDLAEKIIMIIKNKDLRIKLIKNGFNLAKTNTLEIQTAALLAIVNNLIVVNKNLKNKNFTNN